MPEASGATQQPAAKPKILIVDDEPQILQVLQNALLKQGFEVIVSTDGLEGLNLARTRSPALVILDLHLPKMDGHAICKMLKSDQRYKQTPVLMLTASVEAEDREWASKSGADAYANKPFDLQQILTTINALLAARRPSPASPAPTAPATG